MAIEKTLNAFATWTGIGSSTALRGWGMKIGKGWPCSILSRVLMERDGGVRSGHLPRAASPGSSSSQPDLTPYQHHAVADERTHSRPNSMSQKLARLVASQTDETKPGSPRTRCVDGKKSPSVKSARRTQRAQCLAARLRPTSEENRANEARPQIHDWMDYLWGWSKCANEPTRPRS